MSADNKKEADLSQNVLGWLWDVYPELYDEPVETLHLARDMVLSYLEARNSEHIEAHSKGLKKMLERRFYFLDSEEKPEPINPGI